MATVKQAIHELDYVEFLDSVDRVELEGQWPAGTRGTVVSERDDLKLVEITDPEASGAALDFVSVHESRLKLITKHSR
jgi:hypothetical protein